MLPRILPLLGILLSACSAAPPPPAETAASEPKVADDLPTWCSTDKKPCVVSRDFATRLCRGQYQGAALFLFQRQSPWQRRWLNVKSGLPARNGEGGPAGAALVYAEELLVLALDEPSTGAVEDANGKKVPSGKKPDMDLLVLRWDGTCASLKASEAVPYLPGTSKHAFVDWTKLDLSVQRSLSREPEIRRAVEARDTACRAGGSPECQGAEEKLSNTIVSHVRRGTKLSMPEQRP